MATRQSSDPLIPDLYYYECFGLVEAVSPYQGVTVKEKTAHLICNVLPSWSARVAGLLYGSCVLRAALRLPTNSYDEPPPQTS